MRNQYGKVCLNDSSLSVILSFSHNNAIFITIESPSKTSYGRTMDIISLHNPFILFYDKLNKILTSQTTNTNSQKFIKRGPTTEDCIFNINLQKDANMKQNIFKNESWVKTNSVVESSIDHFSSLVSPLFIIFCLTSHL